MTLPPSLEQWPPTVTAAVWKALEDRSELAAKRSSVPSEEATRVSSQVAQAASILTLALVDTLACTCVFVRNNLFTHGIIHVDTCPC